MSAAQTPAVEAMRQRHQAVIDGASMGELVACGRIFHAAINVHGRGFEDDDFLALASFDDVMSEVIARRRPASLQEFAAKVAYLLGRIEGESMSDDATEAVLNGLKEDAALLCTRDAQRLEVAA